MVSNSADSSGDRPSSPLFINCSTAATIRSYSSSDSIALSTMRLARRTYFLRSRVRVALMTFPPSFHIFVVRQDAANEQDATAKRDGKNLRRRVWSLRISALHATASSGRFDIASRAWQPAYGPEKCRPDRGGW